MASADVLYSKKYYLGAMVLYFRVVLAMTDLTIANVAGHTERLNILKKNNPELATNFERALQLYHQTYSKPVTKSMCDQMRKNASQMI